MAGKGNLEYKSDARKFQEVNEGILFFLEK